MRVNPIVLAMTCVVAFATLARAEDAPKKEEAPVAQTAVFAVPDLGDEAVKKLTTALAKTAGIVSAKAEADKGRFLVTFETAKTDAETLTALVTNVAPDAKLETVEAADAKAAGPDCGKCPSRSSCGKAKTAS
jgi:hypothetical protein